MQDITPVDPITFEVLRCALIEATEEMAVTLRRSAYSTNIKTRADFSCAFFDARLRTIAQAFTQAVHLGSMVELVPRAVAEYGAGQYCGGLGLRRDYLFPDHAVTFTILADRDREGPWGLFGGEPGQPAEYILNPDGEARRLSSKTTLELQAGDVVSYRTCGGGGYGPPRQRARELVLRDVRAGKLSAQQARDVFGVTI